MRPASRPAQFKSDRTKPNQTQVDLYFDFRSSVVLCSLPKAPLLSVQATKQAQLQAQAQKHKHRFLRENKNPSSGNASTTSHSVLIPSMNSVSVRDGDRNGGFRPNIAMENFFVWREFVWGAIAGAFGEGMMHPIDTLKTRMQSQAIITSIKGQKNILQMVTTVWTSGGLKGFYRGIAPGVTGSLATGATYFGVIESTKKCLEEVYPNLSGHWSHFIAGAIGDTLGSFVYVPCEVIKQRMQVQGTRGSWISQNALTNCGPKMHGYYSGMFQAGSSILKEQGIRGLYTGYWSTLARDVPFAGLMVTFYEALKDLSEYGRKIYFANSGLPINSTFEGLVLGGLAGGLSAYLTTPFDVIKTRLQVQGSTIRYKGWLDAFTKIWADEGMHGMFRGSIPRIMWYIPASAITFMAVEFLREHFNKKLQSPVGGVSGLSVDPSSKVREAA